METFSELKENWLELFKVSPSKLAEMSQVDGVITGFNVNIDAVIKIKGEILAQWVNSLNLPDKSVLLQKYPAVLAQPVDLCRGFYNSFKDGAADEWLVDNTTVQDWIVQTIGLSNCRCQMGGQAGIIANVMSVCKVKSVLAHAISLSQDQCNLFLSNENLLGANSESKLNQIRSSVRANDLPLIHFILEFEKGDVIHIEGLQDVTCPRNNRFIVTYDPDNFDLKIDQQFITSVLEYEKPINYLTLSGYQLMREKLTTGGCGLEQIDNSLQIIKNWRAKHPEMWVHLELAETHDRAILLRAIEQVGKYSDSIGLNEVELNDALEVLKQDFLLEQCKTYKNAIVRYLGMKFLFEYLGVKRIQIHFYGLYITLAKLDLNPQKIRDGMILASTVAAAKAGTGTIEVEENLLWAQGHKVHDNSLRQLQMLSEFLGNNNNLLTTGIYTTDKFHCVAVPTILVDKPITLVGMGDTISSISLVGTGATQ